MSNAKSYPPGEPKPARKRPQARASGSAMFSRLAWQEIAHQLDFSKRELEIVRATFDGQTEIFIAAKLGISTHTVHTHVERLHRKLAVSDRGRLILCVVDEFLRLTAAPDSILPSICANRTRRRRIIRRLS